MEELTQHLVRVAGKESIALPDDCASLIAAAAEGSVRDALSLLDQAIAMHTDSAGMVNIVAESVRDMLGLADKTQSFTLLKHLFGGDTQAALADAQRLHHQGADPAMLLSDLLDITHYLTRIVVAPVLVANLHYSPAEQALAKEMAATLNVPALTRAWQILSRGVEEMRHADHAASILDMVLVRLGYASALPTPAELVRSAQSQPALAISSPASHRIAGASSGTHAIAPSAQATGMAYPSPPASSTVMATTRHALPTGGATALATRMETAPLAEVHSYAEMVALFEQQREALLASHLINDMRLVAFEPGRITVHPIAHMNPDVPARINRRLSEWTGKRWTVVYSEESNGEPTLREQREAALRQAREYAIAHPKVQAVLEAFPGATVIDFAPNKT